MPPATTARSCGLPPSSNPIIQSMSRKANCWDNAPIESFLGTRKTELVHPCEYPDRHAARRDLFAYIEGYYRRLLQSSADPLRSQLHHPGTSRPENRITWCPLFRGKVSRRVPRGVERKMSGYKLRTRTPQPQGNRGRLGPEMIRTGAEEGDRAVRNPFRARKARRHGDRRRTRFRDHRRTRR